MEVKSTAVQRLLLQQINLPVKGGRYHGRSNIRIPLSRTASGRLSFWSTKNPGGADRRTVPRFCLQLTFKCLPLVEASRKTGMATRSQQRWRNIKSLDHVPGRNAPGLNAYSFPKILFSDRAIESPVNSFEYKTTSMVSRFQCLILACKTHFEVDYIWTPIGLQRIITPERWVI
ncbi:uncharacterized protein LOC129759121 [Uranotaenia lowii]|uniref:uncharacterized protein LOC129753497 n=1 Tax=Uranotaenia lowii TaxID=190385 RepID=UPI002479A2EF|nr:uncharacterized protein LOC129753497 [Uranotaenia lowii]XP_055605293.1 uncharacterized protein LOC129753498 [Uranotaenia lowii]XP_055605294.1 uncharacterized protein LOC129753499 [Uranotaenia lowii]XP_055605295.1 uncharacterized protein LOC129753500 [Uranotaenia lowii]XP_055605296.1 uncharacterized protein LOC129753501 [Uranotaenia lowii]XP_055605297.1 uncharacterized protein LOC129753502 [Uranotaenia lowii]XP_055612512.1 uncharacterized protein LOC129759121 [Uranotaenia lowii]